jgi:type I restriction enzyme S subunit
LRLQALKHFCSEPPVYGLNIPATDYAASGVRLLRTTDIGADGAVISDAPGVYVAPNEAPRKLMLRNGDILLSRSGTLGRSLLYGDKLGPATHAGYLVRFRLSADNHPPYVAYSVQSSFLQDAVRADAVESTIGNFNAEKYANVKLPWWPPPRQRAIAKYLDRETKRIGALIEAKRRLASSNMERSTARRTWRLLRGCDPTSGRGQLPPDWQLRTLGTTATLQRGHDLPSDMRIPGDVPVVSSGGVSGWNNRATCQPPGVVTGRYGTVGEAYFLDVPYWPLNTTLYVSDFRGNYPRWVYHLLSSIPLAIDAEKSAVTGINRNIVKQLKVPVPPVREQERISQDLDREFEAASAVDAAIAASIGVLRERRQALITAAISGQVDIPEAA